jgi:undecaprenyl pyrophosphate phosphatase UppP
MILLGCVQGLSLLPGVSRLAATYVCARWLAICPRRSFEISWLIAWPLMSAAFLQSLCFIVMKKMSYLFFAPKTVSLLLIGTLISFFIFRWVAKQMYKQRLWPFALYMIVPFSMWLLFYYA